MCKLHKTITMTASVLLLVLSGNASAINKCVSPSGQTSYTDKPCPAGSKSDTITVKTGHHNSTADTATDSTKSKKQSGKSGGQKDRHTKNIIADKTQAGPGHQTK